MSFLEVQVRTGRSVPIKEKLGLELRRAFEHDVLCVDKHYADQVLALERRGCSEEVIQKGAHAQLNVYATDLSGLPDSLLRHPLVNWHNQQLGRLGLIAAAGLFTPDGRRLFVTFLQSDLATQVGKFPEYRSIRNQVTARFERWCPILLNAILDLALDKGFEDVVIPSSRTILGLTKKAVNGGMYVRAYDEAARRFRTKTCAFVGVTEVEEVGSESLTYWVVDPRENLDRVERLEPRSLRVSVPAKSICINHDIEENVDTDVTIIECRTHLERMLEIERNHEIRGTYSILGKVFRDKAPTISARGHAVAFHSFDHDVSNTNQLHSVRRVDLQVKGYRPPQSRITEELDDWRMSRFNFEWLATSRFALGFDEPRLGQGIAKLPISSDDWPLASRQMSYEAWETRILSQAERAKGFYAFGVHDCYGRHWIDRYSELLGKLAKLGTFETFDDVAARMFYCSRGFDSWTSGTFKV